MHPRASAPFTDPNGRPWSVRMAASALDRYAPGQSQWHYKDGLLFKGILHLWLQTQEQQYLEQLTAFIDRHVDADGRLVSYSLDEYNLDQINPGKLLFPLYRLTGQERYRRAIVTLREQLRGQPRTTAGGFWHKKIYPYQMWLDGIYMEAPFYAEYAATFDEPAGFDDVALQITLIERRTRDAATGLLYHAWDERRQQPWANPDTGCSPHFWGRAIGWYMMALVDVLHFFPPDHPACEQFVAILQRTTDAITRVQDEATGLWWQVLDKGDIPGNYLEASSTCMYVYAIARGIRKGYLDAGRVAVAEKGFNGLLNHLVATDQDGRFSLHGTCTSAGLGGNPYRDGSFEYYISEPVATNDLHGVGAFILAAVEMESVVLSRQSPAKT